MADCSTCGGAGCMDDSGAKCPVCGGSGEEPKCPYGMSGDTCVPIMEDYPCICALQALNTELVAALNAIDGQVDETGRYEEPADYYAEVPWEFIDQARAAIAKARGS